MEEQHRLEALMEGVEVITEVGPIEGQLPEEGAETRTPRTAIDSLTMTGCP